MRMRFSEWVNEIVPLMINRTIEKAETEVQEGLAKAYFHAWELKFELTPNRSLSDKIIKG